MMIGSMEGAPEDGGAGPVCAGITRPRLPPGDSAAGVGVVWEGGVGVEVGGKGA